MSPWSARGPTRRDGRPKAGLSESSAATLRAVSIARTIITGMHGTVAPAIAHEVAARGGEVLAWNREAVSPDDLAAVAAFIRSSRATALVHCAMGSPHWAECMAATCAARGMVFLHTGSVSVFGAHQEGPFSLDATPEPQDDYGRYKLACERLVLAASPEAIVVRLGWQIALRGEGNQMVRHLLRQHAEHGHITASTRWFPACSFVDDTARALVDLLERGASGLYQLDGNPDWDFRRIVTALSRALDGGWDIRATEDVRLNTLMRDARLAPASIAMRLGQG